WGFKPDLGYISLSRQYDLQSDKPPPVSWNDVRFKSLIDHDGFVATRGGDAAYYQIGCPNSMPDDEEFQRSKAAYLELDTRLKNLHRLAQVELTTRFFEHPD